MKVLVTGAAGNAGQAVTRLLADEGVSLRLSDVAPPPGGMAGLGEFVRCDRGHPMTCARPSRGWMP